MALVVCSGVSFWQAIVASQARSEAEAERKRAQASYEKAREAVQQMLRRVADEEVGAIPEMKVVRQKLLEDAVLFYTELLKLNPRDAAAYSLRGDVHATLQHYDLAIADITRASELDPGFWGHHFQLFVWLHTRHDTKQDSARALVHARRAAELAPREPMPHWAVAYILAGLGRTEEARGELKQFVERMADNDGHAHTELSRLYGVLGDDHNSLKHAQRAVEIDPMASQYQRNLSVILAKLGRTDEALTAINKPFDSAGHPTAPAWQTCIFLAPGSTKSGEKSRPASWTGIRRSLYPRNGHGSISIEHWGVSGLGTQRALWPM